jgi:hypothetical protein
MFLPISSKSESSPEEDPSSVDNISVDANTLETHHKYQNLFICHCVDDHTFLNFLLKYTVIILAQM